MYQHNLLSSAIRRALLVAVPSLALLACSGDDGKDGSNGAAGAAGPEGVAGPEGADGNDGHESSLLTPGLTRLATVPAGAEVTGAFLSEDGDLFFNVQHPEDTNEAQDADGKVFNTGTVGVLTGVNINKLPKNLVSVGVPRTEQEQETVQVAYGQYQVIAQTGDTYNNKLAQGLGHILDASGENEVAIIDSPDFNGYIETADNEGYLFTNWESVPGGVSRLKIMKDADTGRWSVDEDDVMMIDFGKYGTIANCFGSVSPWGTPLTSEEWGNFGDNTTDWNNPAAEDKYKNRDTLAKYTDNDAATADDADVFPNTYRYHYIVEITEPSSAAPVPVKHYAMGRFEHENSIVMPDQKTVYLSQDDTNGVFFKFVADNEADLSSGTLYAAKLTQDKGSNEPLTTGFDIEWKKLAHGNNSEIESWIAEYDNINYSSFVEGQSNYLTDADAEAWAAGETNYPVTNDGGSSVTAGKAMDDRIAFLESRKAARAKEATAEWRKFEGIYINPKRAEEAVEGTDLVPGEDVKDAYVYFAIADLDKGMIDDEGDIQLSSRVKDCGGVYRMRLEADYDVKRIEPVVMGSTYRSTLEGAERCDVNALSQPDNVIVMDDGRIIIGEDGFQDNNTLWLYNPKVND
ncbi:alkaline phosphatase PhoX [Agaribacterium haliotis]|uniref:alkaline phosphatase PhoX n=1 Tax=Agaribacterium haliotis TaxID=2013869 RepID=UPI000BB5522A|nr:alkaline phosphatase PhoX [Agaribacterium haliotis]